MQTEMKKLVVLAELALHKNTLIPVTQTEFLHTLNRLETALDKQPFSNISPRAVKNNLLYTSEVLAGLVYNLSHHACCNYCGKPGMVITRATMLQKKIDNALEWYCYHHHNHLNLLPVKALTKALLEAEIRLEQNTQLAGLYAVIKPEITNLKSTRIWPYHRWLWWSRFLTALPGMPEADTASLENLLVCLNFNIPGFISRLCVNLQQAIDNSETQEAKIRLVTAELSKYSLMAATAHTYVPAEKPVKQIMLTLLRQHAFYLSHAPAAGGAGKQQPACRLSTTLSVPQLALFVRLLTDARIISETNQSALLKNVAAIVSTARTASISPESLRVNYYTPGLAAKNIVKDHLINMINLLRKY
ncbi:hypothetical protein [Parafilimonas sp.]|uniref:hypothetical protein n=1 Tax=Parafilimonas sp. TaxID=1969739 RepID=UPI003F815C04